ncbi:MAG: Smr/MutS family protein [Burkholderiaceae bacterium]|jgi:DNA-nicking Smr family endonuclease|nr:Smr/MutS family protein [Burkholderiaceae bacterium]
MGAPPLKAKSFQDLQDLRAQLAQQQARAARQAADHAARQLAEWQQRQLFARAVGPVRALDAAATQRVRLTPEPAPPLPRQRQRDEQAVLREAISDAFDAGTLLEVDAEHGFRQPGIGADVTVRLRRGHWAVQREIDLHGLRREEAREALGAFLREATRAGIRCVRVVHGKGRGSPGREPVLKALVQRWLAQRREVLAFVQAKPLEGGAGALLALLAAG